VPKKKIQFKERSSRTSSFKSSCISESEGEVNKIQVEDDDFEEMKGFDDVFDKRKGKSIDPKEAYQL